MRDWSSCSQGFESTSCENVSDFLMFCRGSDTQIFRNNPRKSRKARIRCCRQSVSERLHLRPPVPLALRIPPALAAKSPLGAAARLLTACWVCGARRWRSRTSSNFPGLWWLTRTQNLKKAFENRFISENVQGLIDFKDNYSAESGLPEGLSASKIVDTTKSAVRIIKRPERDRAHCIVLNKLVDARITKHVSRR